MAPAALKIGAYALMAFSAVDTARQQKRVGDQAEVELRAQGNEELAIASRVAADEKRKADYLKGRLRAAVAAGGGDTRDKSVLDAVEGIEARGEYNALTALYEGQVSRDFRYRQGRQYGKAGGRQSRATTIGGLASIMSGASREWV